TERARCEGFLFVGWRPPGLIGNDPDLEQMGSLIGAGIALTVTNAGTSAHTLHVAGADHRYIAQIVAMLDLSFDDNRHDLHVLVTMLREASPGYDEVLVEHPKVAETHIFRVVVIGEGKAVPGINLSALMATAGAAIPETNHIHSLERIAASAATLLSCSGA